MIYNGDYCSFRDLPSYVRPATSHLRPHKARFRFLVARGMSGVVVGAPLSLRLGRPLVIIRKPDEGRSHGNRTVINPDDARGPYLILDDFISSGATYHCIRTAMREHALDAVYAGTYLYADGGRLLWDGNPALTYYPHGKTLSVDGWRTNVAYRP
jgi:hypothetical protein